MVEHRENQLEKIKNAKDAVAIEHTIDIFILEMKKKKIEDYLIANFIRRLDISLLMLERKDLTDKQWDNIKLAQKILIDKIVPGSRHDFVKSN